MKQKFIRFVFAVPALFFAVSVTIVLLVSWDGNSEEPPCAACEYAIESAQIPGFSVCDSPTEQLSGELFRVKAEFVHDAGHIFLTDPGCKVKRMLHVRISETTQACDSTLKKLSRYTGYKLWYDSSTPVTVTGRYGVDRDRPNSHESSINFEIVCLESVGRGEMSNWNRLRFEIYSRSSYTVGKIFQSLR